MIFLIVYYSPNLNHNDLNITRTASFTATIPRPICSRTHTYGSLRSQPLGTRTPPTYPKKKNVRSTKSSPIHTTPRHFTTTGQETNAPAYLESHVNAFSLARKALIRCMPHQDNRLPKYYRGVISQLQNSLWFHALRSMGGGLWVGQRL